MKREHSGWIRMVKGRGRPAGWLFAAALAAGCTLPFEADVDPLFCEEKRAPCAPGPERLIAAQILYLDCRSLAELDSIVEDLARRGVNTVIWRAFHNPGDRPFPLASALEGDEQKAGSPKREQYGVYFGNRFVPVAGDILARVAHVVRARGLRFFAWMTTKHTEFGVSGEGVPVDFRYDFEKRAMVPARDLDLFSEPALERLEAIYRDLAAQPIDGILLQDDLCLKHNEGFSPAARALFEQHSGTVLDPGSLYIGPYRGAAGRYYVREYTDLFWAWSRWKAGQVASVAARLSRAAREVRPEIQVAANFYYEVAWEPRWALAWLSQDLDAVETAGLDYAAVMMYQRQIGRELGLSGRETIEAVGEMARRLGRRFRRPEQVIIKLQIADWGSGEPLDSEEVGRHAARVLREGSFSLAFVPYRAGYPIDKALGRRGWKWLR